MPRYRFARVLSMPLRQRKRSKMSPNRHNVGLDQEWGRAVHHLDEERRQKALHPEVRCGAHGRVPHGNKTKPVISHRSVQDWGLPRGRMVG